jgi:hypothetical protein
MLRSRLKTRHLGIWIGTVLLVVLGALGIGVHFSRLASAHAPADLKEDAPHASYANQEGAPQNKPDNEGYWHKVVKPDILPVWLTMLVTAGVGLIALGTLADIKKQTRIGLRTSLATKKSVEAYIATERPFVIIETRGEQGFEFWAVNYGKSPAQIIFSNPVPIVDTFLLTELPEVLNYGVGFNDPNVQQINVQWIAPGKTHFLGDFNPKVMESLRGDAASELAQSLRVLLVYSAFKYRGIHSKEVYTSTYCYRKYPSGLRMWGAYGWNQYT